MAALLFLWYNGNKLVSLLNAPITERSAAVKLASKQWARLESVISKRSKDDLNDKKVLALLSAVTPGTGLQGKQGIKAAEIQKTKRKTEDKALLPVLSGIVRVSDRLGNVSSIALFEGKRFVENDRVKGFRVQRITKKGVLLLKAGKSWFVPAPEVYFSLDHGR